MQQACAETSLKTYFASSTIDKHYNKRFQANLLPLLLFQYNHHGTMCQMCHSYHFGTCVLTHSQSSRESSPGLCRNSAARKRVFSSLNSPFRHFIFPVYLWVGESGKSPWYPSSCRPRFYKISNSPTPFSSNLKQCREFSPPQGKRIQSIPLYSPTYPPGWPGVLPLGQANDMCINNCFLERQI